VVHALEAYRDVWRHLLDGVQLQRRMRGVEVAIGAFFNGEHFIEPVAVNFEHKRFFPGNLGPMTGEMGTTMFWASCPELFRRTIARFEADLRRERYVGYFDLNCIVNAEGIWPLELTTRFGFPTIDVQLERPRDYRAGAAFRVGSRHADEPGRAAGHADRGAPALASLSLPGPGHARHFRAGGGAAVHRRRPDRGADRRCKVRGWSLAGCG